MDFVPEITAFEPVKTEDGEEITPEQQRAEAVKDAAQRVGVSDTTAEQLTQHYPGAGRRRPPRRRGAETLPVRGRGNDTFTSYPGKMP